MTFFDSTKFNEENISDKSNIFLMKKGERGKS